MKTLLSLLLLALACGCTPPEEEILFPDDANVEGPRGRSGRRACKHITKDGQVLPFDDSKTD